MMKKNTKVVLILGHCGTSRNEYDLFEGTTEEATDFLYSLPLADERDFCHCGNYTGTQPVFEQAILVEIDERRNDDDDKKTI